MVIHEAQRHEGGAELLFGHEACGGDAPLLQVEVIRVAVGVKLIEASVQPALDLLYGVVSVEFTYQAAVLGARLLVV